jgi:hypothetical protein
LAEIRSRLADTVSQIEDEFQPVEQLLLSSDTTSNASAAQATRQFLNDEERDRVRKDLERDRRRFAQTRQSFNRDSQLMDMLTESLGDKSFPKFMDTNRDAKISNDELPARWLEIRKPSQIEQESYSYQEIILEARNGMLDLRESLKTLLRSLQFFQVNLRVELVALNRFVLPGGDTFPDIDEVVAIGLNQRHDLMNARALVMDARRIVEVAASELESTLDVTMTGTLGTGPTSRKPFNFSGSAASYRAGLAFDTPADKLAERNAYNAALINYQRARRDFMAEEDQVKQEIRVSWRQLKVSEQQLEIDRQAVRVAALQYDISSQPANIKGESSALDLLTALDSVLGAQDSLLGDWITWEISRLNIYRDMGIMEVDERGLWVDPFYVGSIPDVPEEPFFDSSSLPNSSPNFAANVFPADIAVPVLKFDTEIGGPE